MDAPNAQDALLTETQLPPTVEALHHHRIAPLDVLRGIAVLGGLFVSIWLMGGLTSTVQAKMYAFGKGGNFWLLASSSALLEGKMLGLICIAFGAAMVAFFQRPGMGNRLSPADFFMRRQLWLIGFGVANGVLLFWTNDVLFHLGVMGILAYPLVSQTVRGMLLAAALCGVIFAGKMYWNYADTKKAYHKYEKVGLVEKKIKTDSLSKAAITKTLTDTSAKKAKGDTLTKKQADDKAAWEGMAKEMKYDSGAVAANKKDKRQRYAKLYDSNLQQTQGREAAYTYRRGVWEMGMLLLLGMAFFKLGIFTGAHRRRKLLALGLGLTVFGWLLAAYRIYMHGGMIRDLALYVRHHAVDAKQLLPLEIAATSAGYTLLIVAMVQHKLGAWWIRGLTAVGQMALSNYLFQSLIALLFFTGVGFGNYGKLSQIELYAVAAEMTLVQVALSMAWLRHHKQGPAEWLLHSLVTKHRPAWLSKKPAAASTNQPSQA